MGLLGPLVGLAIEESYAGKAMSGLQTIVHSYYEAEYQNTDRP